ncbi:MAG: glutamate--tRNA ligase [Bacteroidales bacterium]|nr:glutamate--tRNA ligase [Bacteroidales bacterium]
MERRTRVRFAPSPTGPLHMGGVRTALYNYLWAKQHGGDFILRIEDTDSHRFVPGAEAYIIEALSWCGIRPDEGVDENGQVVSVKSERHPHAPYRQSERKPIYRQYAEQLVKGGFAYYAFDSAEELAALRAQMEAQGQTFIYNHSTRGQLRNSLTLPAEEVERLLRETTDWTVRFKMPEDRIVEMDDMIRGHVEVNSGTLDDKVLWKRADELPTYHLANIVDDHLMEITEVIRGEEWLPSLPLHYLLYEAFGWQDTMPRFAHLSLLLKPDGKGKLSKRDGDKMGFPVFPLKWVNAEGEVSRGYREDGYFPEAFVNLLAMLGWNPGDERELFTLDELVAAFSIERIVKSGARFNPEKAKWFNKEYLRQKSDETLRDAYLPILKEQGIQITDGNEKDFDGGKFSKEYVKDVVRLIKDRATFVKDFWDIAPYLFRRPTAYEEKDVAKFWKEENTVLAKELATFIRSWNGPLEKETFGPAVETYIKEREWPMGKVMNCLRLSLVGASSGLGIADMICLIGLEEFGRRVDNAITALG